jgi:hypothetical protein
VRVRTASSDDVDDLVALVGSMTDLGPVRGRRVARSWPDGFRTRCEKVLADPAHRVVVAVDETDAVVGAAAPTTRDANRFFARLGFAPQVIRRIVGVHSLRRALASADPIGEPTLPPARAGLTRALPRGPRSRLRSTG